MKVDKFRHEFVEFIPKEPSEGVLYISTDYATVVHLCACGCGTKVVTPLSPAKWSLNFDGDTISLNPSIGNWQFPCRSHYVIRRNRVQWAPAWSNQQIEHGRRRDAADVERYLSGRGLELTEFADEPIPSERRSFMNWLAQLLRGKQGRPPRGE
jgi:hypothetical protein